MGCLYFDKNYMIPNNKTSKKCYIVELHRSYRTPINHRHKVQNLTPAAVMVRYNREKTSNMFPVNIFTGNLLNLTYLIMYCNNSNNNNNSNVMSDLNIKHVYTL